MRLLIVLLFASINFAAPSSGSARASKLRTLHAPFQDQAMNAWHESLYSHLFIARGDDVSQFCMIGIAKDSTKL